MNPPSVKSIFIYPIKSCKGIALDAAFISPTGFKWDRLWMVVDSRGRMLTQRVNPELALVDVSLPEQVLKEPWNPLSSGSALGIQAPGMDLLQIPLIAAVQPSKVDTASVWEWTGVAFDEGNDATEWFTRYLGKSCRLVRFDTENLTRVTDPTYARDYKVTFSDGYPFLLISQASLDMLNEKLASVVSINRFRPNILVQGCEPFAEDLWETFTIAGLTFHGVKLCSRCKVTTVNQETAEVGNEPLATLRTFRDGKLMSLTKKGKVYFGQNLVCEQTQKLHHTSYERIQVGDALTILQTRPSNTDCLV